MVAWGLGAPGWILIVIVAAVSVAVPVGAALLKRRTQEEWVRRITGTRVVTDKAILTWLNDIEKRHLGEIRFDLRVTRDTQGRMDGRIARLERWRDGFEGQPDEKEAPTPDRSWSATGGVNRSGQINLGCTEPPRHGSNRFQYLFVMHCPVCDRNYGADGSELFERRCPYHQGGTPASRFAAMSTTGDKGAVIQEEQTMEQFSSELQQHLEAFPFSPSLLKLPVTVTGHPRPGLTVVYRPGKDPASPEEIIKEVSRVGAAGVAGVGVGAVAGVTIGKFVFGSVVARVGIASAGVGIGVPFLAPIAVGGGVLGSLAYGLYRLGKLTRDKTNAEAVAKELVLHMEQFRPSAEWPSVAIYLSSPDRGLSAFWQPRIEGGYVE